MRQAPTTAKGRATRERILQAAAELVAEKGAAGMSLDDVRARTGASRSQLYHYFRDKHGLVEAVVDHQSATVLGLQAHALASVNSWEDLERWAALMVGIVADQGATVGRHEFTVVARYAFNNRGLEWTGPLKLAVTPAPKKRQP